MRSLEELIDHSDPGIDRIREWSAEAKVQHELLAPSDSREQILVETQVTTRSTMGAVVFETGGVLIEGGWLRFLGSGNPQLPRNLSTWNQGRSNGFLLVADDVVGGFFAINGGAFGEDLGSMYYWPPDNHDWEPLGLGYTDLFTWSLTEAVRDFYSDLRWPSWEKDLAGLSTDRCFSFYPFLWTEQGSITSSYRSDVPVEEAFSLKLQLIDQLG